MNREEPILDDGDHQVLDRHGSFEDPETPAEFQKYCHAFARMIFVMGGGDSYRMENLLRISSIGNAVGRGEVPLDDGEAALDDVDVSVRGGVPDPEAINDG